MRSRRRAPRSIRAISSSRAVLRDGASDERLSVARAAPSRRPSPAAPGPRSALAIGPPGNGRLPFGGARDVDGDGLRDEEGELPRSRRPPSSDGLARLLSGDSSAEHLQPADAGRSRRPDGASRAGPITNDVGVVDRGHQPAQRRQAPRRQERRHAGRDRRRVDGSRPGRQYVVVELHRHQLCTTGAVAGRRSPTTLGRAGSGRCGPTTRAPEHHRSDRAWHAQKRGDAIAVAGVGRGLVPQCAHGIRSERGRVSNSGSSGSVELRASSRIVVDRRRRRGCDEIEQPTDLVAILRVEHGVMEHHPDGPTRRHRGRDRPSTIRWAHGNALAARRPVDRHRHLGTARSGRERAGGVVPRQHDGDRRPARRRPCRRAAVPRWREHRIDRPPEHVLEPRPAGADVGGLLGSRPGRPELALASGRARGSRGRSRAGGRGPDRRRGGRRAAAQRRRVIAVGIAATSTATPAASNSSRSASSAASSHPASSSRKKNGHGAATRVERRRRPGPASRSRHRGPPVARRGRRSARAERARPPRSRRTGGGGARDRHRTTLVDQAAPATALAAGACARARRAVHPRPPASSARPRPAPRTARRPPDDRPRSRSIVVL